ncbi:MAG: hypothetical protein M3Z98_03095 [Candidatus Dormibacteraeota bacterium]|nr:hypothetical protein [Candidatus Dormibacteraeota bacterium]
MGFLDSLFGRTRLPKSNEDKLFAMSTAAVGLEATAGIKPAGRAGIVFKRLPPGRFDQLKKDIVDLVKLQGAGEGLALENKTDDLGFDWLIMSGTDFQEAIAAIHSAATSLLEEGLGDLLLAVAFRFEREGRPEYWIYSYKQGTYYPFVPTGNHQRDNAEELRLAALGKAELPVEPTLERWYALWGIPV